MDVALRQFVGGVHTFFSGALSRYTVSGKFMLLIVRAKGRAREEEKKNPFQNLSVSQVKVTSLKGCEARKAGRHCFPTFVPLRGREEKC